MSESDALFRHTFRDSPIGMAILDEVGHYQQLNPAFARILEMTPDELEGRNFAEFTHPDDLPRDVELLNQLAAGTLPYYQIQKRYINKSGAVVWTRVTVTDVQSEIPGEPHHFVTQIEDVTEIRRAKDLLERRALYDHLTGLANRTLLIDRLSHALESHQLRSANVAVIFMDVDHFKVINDSLGHEAGDVLLGQMAQRLQSAVRSGDTVARLGGDEFVIVLENLMSEAAAEGLLRVITAAVQSPIMIENREIVPTVSAGLALAREGSSAESLVRDADTAMYAAKQAGRSRFRIFDTHLRSDALNALSIESELRTALREGELALHYQPVVNLDTGEIAAFEALVRWNHPDRGLLLPDDFIDICEQANLVVPLGSFVLHEACAFIARHPEFSGRVFVNVSTRQIGTADLSRALHSAINTSGVDPKRIGLEITESGMLLASSATNADLKAIAELGVDLILDDFGTGYSALNSVLANPVAGLKLAREFTTRLGDNAAGDRISIAIATLTKSLDMYGVVEGIETQEQRAIAIRHGWTFAQGFLFGRPVAESDLRFEVTGQVRVVPRESVSRPTRESLFDEAAQRDATERPGSAPPSGATPTYSHL